MSVSDSSVSTLSESFTPPGSPPRRRHEGRVGSPWSSRYDDHASETRHGWRDARSPTPRHQHQFQREAGLRRGSRQSQSVTPVQERQRAHERTPHQFHRNSSDELELERPEALNLASRLDRFADAILKLAQKPTGNQRYINDNVFPKFDPGKRAFTAGRWLKKINKVAEIYNIDSKEKLLRAISRLEGDARIWYDHCDDIETWQEFSDALELAFPRDTNFGVAFLEAAMYRNTEGQDLVSYCVKKLGLLDRLETTFSQKQMVEFVVEGIRDEQLKKTILAARYKNVHELKKYFSIHDTASERREQRNDRTRDNDKNRPNRKRGHQPVGESGRDDGTASKREKSACFECGQTGHFKSECPKLKSKKESQSQDRTKHCSFHNSSSHDTKDCRAAKKDKDSTDKPSK